MAKLYFRYGAMDSSKTANALMVRYNYLERDQRVLLLKPRIENRDGATKVVSRIGLSADCEYVEDIAERAKTEDVFTGYNAVIVDEVQFLEPELIDFLSDVVDTYDIPVLCYGLRTDFRGQLFDASKRLMELADRIECIPTICWCGKQAHFNARIDNGEITREGAQVELGGNGRYVALCRKHYKLGQWKPLY